MICIESDSAFQFGLDCVRREFALVAAIAAVPPVPTILSLFASYLLWTHLYLSPRDHEPQLQSSSPVSTITHPQPVTFT
jgi:hypothetical protein